jgi:hypothetical protein
MSTPAVALRWLNRFCGASNMKFSTQNEQWINTRNYLCNCACVCVNMSNTDVLRTAESYIKCDSQPGLGCRVF